MIEIAGMGWITGLGSGLQEVYDRSVAGERPEVKEVANPESGRIHRTYAIPQQLVEHLARNPRLRRSSPISYYTVAAALAAVADAGLQITPEFASRTAVVFAAADGSVVYTRKFYEQIVRQGAQTASPLLFPETVYNAAASHLSAQLGIDGASYTVVGDAAAGLSAIALGEQLIDTGEADYCVVVAGEELDWILCEAYHDWRLARTPLTEGAGALLLARSGKLSLEVHAGHPFFQQREATAALERTLREMSGLQEIQFVASCANGTFIDTAEKSALQSCGIIRAETDAFPKQYLGESLGASALIQLIYAAQRMQRTGEKGSLVPVVGFNWQAGAAILRQNTSER